MSDFPRCGGTEIGNWCRFVILVVVARRFESSVSGLLRASVVVYDAACQRVRVYG